MIYQGEAVGRMYGEWMIPMAIIISNLDFREPGFSTPHRLPGLLEGILAVWKDVRRVVLVGMCSNSAALLFPLPWL
jgi:hypothetical protein